ncbi:MAG: hypothetical protein LAP87_06640 [Acidobacteriia bacterium]|nr:hypothetical protein [Terriglobia bacterium]
MRTSKTASIAGRLPGFYTAGGSSVLIGFLDVFGQVLEQAETDLLEVMRAHWVDKAANEGSRGFDSAQKGDLDKIFTLYLENLGGTSELKQLQRRDGADGVADDAVYRERIKGLLQVLMHGASTVEGIVSIVAANLGIAAANLGIGATADALATERQRVAAARSQIRVVEFLPGATKPVTWPVALFQEFSVVNSNPTPAAPQVRIRIVTGVPLHGVTLVMATGGGGSVGYAGLVNQDDLLSFFADGTVLLNGVPVIAAGALPQAPPGPSTWRVEALMQFGGGPRFLPPGRFDVSAFDAAPPGLFVFDGPAVSVDVSLAQLSPGFFTVYIPWDIPGFTEQFDRLPDNPRNQIQYIVNKVKAAGVSSAIVFEKRFCEAHETGDAFSGSAVRQPLAEDEGLDEVNFDLGSIQKPYPQGIDQGLNDNLILSGMFDYTGFDTLNTFA